MKSLLYYQPCFEKFSEIFSSWEEQCVNFNYSQKYITAVPIALEKKTFPFNGRPGELSFFMKSHVENYENLYVVVGNCPNKKYAHLCAEIITLILSYPEVNFIFEDTDFVTNFLFSQNDSNSSFIPQFSVVSNIKIVENILWSNNLFDASNLRHECRKRKLKTLKVSSIYSHKQEQRKDSLALVIDEETEQCLLNSYLLSANGFRCFPITSFCQFKRVFDDRTLEYKLIVRDFDLQFPDEDSTEYWIRINGETSISLPSATIDLIRGYKYVENQGWYDLTSNEKIEIAEGLHVFDAPSEGYKKLCNPYWNGKNNKTITISQGYKNLELSSKLISSPIRDGVLYLYGISKPLDGIYYPFKNFPKIRDTYKDSQLDIKCDFGRTRDNHDHSIALDLYDIANSIIFRSKVYYANNKYILSAILAEDALELLNGYHITLSIQAYHILAISENAIAMNTIGSDEKALEADCFMHVQKIKSDIEWLVKGTDQNKKNILNQIFSDCRLFCKEKEHFESEDVFLEAMAELNEGCQLFPNKDSKSSINLFIKKHKEFIKDKFDNFIEKVNSYGPESKADVRIDNGKGNADGEENK